MSARPWSREWEPLAEAAGKALRHARGRPRRGAVAEDEAGKLHLGASLTIPELPAASLCAEQIAIARSQLDGGRKIRKLLVIGPGPAGAPPPCGRCLQILRELGTDVDVRWGSRRVERGRGRLGRLLPRAFVDYRTSS
jgi:cytidine deaminase